MESRTRTPKMNYIDVALTMGASGVVASAVGRGLDEVNKTGTGVLDLVLTDKPIAAIISVTARKKMATPALGDIIHSDTSVRAADGKTVIELTCLNGSAAAADVASGDVIYVTIKYDQSGLAARYQPSFS